MSRAFETGLHKITLRNSSTSTMPAYTFVRMSTTTDTDCDLITTANTHWPIGVTQTAINPGACGSIGVSGVTRVKVANAGLAAILRTTLAFYGAAANGRAVRMTASTSMSRAVAIHLFAASDIATMILTTPSRFGY